MRLNEISYTNNIQTTQNQIGFKGLIKVDLSKLSEGKTTNILQDVYESIGQGLKKDGLGQDVFIGLRDWEPVSVHRKTLMIATNENDSLGESVGESIQKYFDSLKTLLLKHLEESEIQKRVTINKIGPKNKAGISEIKENTVLLSEIHDRSAGDTYSFSKNGKYKSEASWTGMSSTYDWE